MSVAQSPTGTCSGAAVLLVAKEVMVEVLALPASVLTAVSSRESALMKWGCSSTWRAKEGFAGLRCNQTPLITAPQSWAYRHRLDLG